MGNIVSCGLAVRILTWSSANIRKMTKSGFQQKYLLDNKKKDLAHLWLAYKRNILNAGIKRKNVDWFLNKFGSTELMGTLW